LLARVKTGGGAFASRSHIGHALELRFLSRARDRRRAIGGRSPMQSAIEQADRLDQADGVGGELVDGGIGVEALVILREELRGIGRLVSRLSLDQRRVLASQLSGESCADFCRVSGWSREKYRKVAQRARAGLRRLIAAEDSAVPAAGAASESPTGPIYADVTPHT
jgi:DNA-directed RNA polymerase specialized sigma24 family protein